MERITGTTEKGELSVNGKGISDLHTSELIGCVNELTNRLAYYEDMDEQKQLIVLPCKVGDTVYHTYFVSCSIQSQPHMPDDGCEGCEQSCDMKHVITQETPNMDRLVKISSEFGKRYFLCRFAAESALTEMQGKERVKTDGN